MFLLVGITEKDLKLWADDRDTDLSLNPKRAVEEGRRKKFPLVMGTKLDDDSSERCTLPLDNWNFMYAEYNADANEDIYTTYPRIPGDPDSAQTIFDEERRLRLIFEAIIAEPTKVEQS